LKGKPKKMPPKMSGKWRCWQCGYNNKAGAYNCEKPIASKSGSFQLMPGTQIAGFRGLTNCNNGRD
jgi:hypothetical protein